jgi:Erv1 / Alr family
MVTESIPPHIWGPSAWELLHALSFCPLVTVAKGKKMFYALQTILPCPKCRISLGNHINETRFPKSKRLWPKWVYSLHNRVNSTNHVDPARIPTYMNVHKHWKKTYASCCNRLTDLNIWKFLFALSYTYTNVPTVRDATLTFYECFMDILPTCFGDYEDIKLFFKENSLSSALQSRKKYMAWTTQFHTEMTHRSFNLKKEFKDTACETTCKLI